MFALNNSREMPRYLNQTDFDLWFTEFVSCCNTLGLHMKHFHPNRTLGLYMEHFHTNLEIEFSDEPKEQSYGSYSIDEIKDMIRQKWDINQKIEGILEGIKGYGDYRRGEYEKLAGAIQNNNKNAKYRDIKEEIDGWFDNIAFTTPILGEYINAQKKIILYTKNIENDYLVGRSNKQNFEKVFVHELFHAYHYCPDSNNMDLEELVRRYDYTCKVVKESLASAFEWYYCTQNGILGADELRDTWRNHSVWTYPYSGAANMINYDLRSSTDSINSAKFIDVYERSTTDMDGTLRILLDPDDFYDIKNAITVRNETVSGPSPSKNAIASQTFVVKNARSFSDESTENYLFAPDKPYYNVMKTVQRGDVIFHIFKHHLYAVSIAKNCFYYSNDAHNRHECGNYIDAAYTVFDSPVDISSLKSHVYYPNKQGDPHYILPQKNLDIIELILQKALAAYPNNATLQLIKMILF